MFIFCTFSIEFTVFVQSKVNKSKKMFTFSLCLSAIKDKMKNQSEALRRWYEAKRITDTRWKKTKLFPSIVSYCCRIFSFDIPVRLHFTIFRLILNLAYIIYIIFSHATLVVKRSTHILTVTVRAVYSLPSHQWDSDLSRFIKRKI